MEGFRFIVFVIAACAFGICLERIIERLDRIGDELERIADELVRGK